jgi:hypothetical protein
MQFSTINNRNFEKPSRNPLNRTNVNIEKKNSDTSQQKTDSACVSSITAKMFDHRNYGKNLKKIIQFSFEYLPRSYKVLV